MSEEQDGATADVPDEVLDGGPDEDVADVRDGGPAEVLVDARGSRCPVPVIEAAHAARDRPAGTVLTVLSTDPASAYDVPAWCRMRGHELLDVTRADGDLEVVVRVRLR